MRNNFWFTKPSCARIRSEVARLPGLESTGGRRIIGKDFRNLYQKGNIDIANGDQETGFFFCFRHLVWGPEKEPTLNVVMQRVATSLGGLHHFMG